MPVIPSIMREDHKFEASLSYIVNSRPAWVHTKTLSQKTNKVEKGGVLPSVFSYNT
jgi:hypothetical protein